MSNHPEPVQEKPAAWVEQRHLIRRRWILPLAWLEHKMDWIAYLLSHWSFLKVLAYLESFGVLIAVIFYFSEAGDRLKQKHYQAWQVINSAQGKGGNGGRIDALETLNADGVPLVGVDLSSAFLMQVKLPGADMARATFDGADARGAVMTRADLEDASLRSANFREAQLQGALLRGSTLDDADFSGANLKDADLAGASLNDTDFQKADLENMKWKNLKSVKGMNISGVTQTPPGFLDWAFAHGAVKRAE